jgi:hypothetical protein
VYGTVGADLNAVAETDASEPAQFLPVIVHFGSNAAFRAGVNVFFRAGTGAMHKSDFRLARRNRYPQNLADLGGGFLAAGFAVIGSDCFRGYGGGVLFATREAAGAAVDFGKALHQLFDGVIGFYLKDVICGGQDNSHRETDYYKKSDGQHISEHGDKSFFFFFFTENRGLSRHSAEPDK